MGRPTGYDIASFGLMIECEPRMAVYAEALKRAITPGCTVIDIGAGFGIFSMLACKYGAGEVIAIEPDPAVELIMPMAQANGCANKITVIRDISTRYTPERKADVIVSDIRGITPLFEHHIASIVDARTRLLAEGGRLVPMRDTLRIAPVHSPRHYQPCVRPWLSNNYGLDLSAGHPYAVNLSAPAQLEPAAFVAQPASFATLDYRTIVDPNVDATVEFVADRTDTVHGLLIWFEAEIGERLRFCNGPGEPPLVYQQKFLPLEQPVRLMAGEGLTARIRVQMVDGKYIWSWDTDIAPGAQRAETLRFRQSTFKGAVFSPDRLRPHAHDQVPQATAQMAIDAACLALVGEGRTLEDIAVAIMERYPDRFGDKMDALGHVTKLLESYRS
ncbi:50S ribosomal protein L11 methyltransferase [Erythrobacter donghaensis]|uniref:50S ribosomal protein L11 methyltransferase n=1 Tax=Erythrobacter donghaensis TaxID=267135 RepID=UPI000A3CCB2C|nr:50S ribosomal protein L11 methyltransferase [Erythrobacter donghaensis]